MRIFHCTNCQHLVFFENSVCVQCGHTLAYLPDLKIVGSLQSVEPEPNLWRAVLPKGERRYRLCANYVTHNICNWAIPETDSNALCSSCRFTLVVPDLSLPRNVEAWYKLEVAKRRLLYSLRELGCPLQNRVEDPQRGLGFELLSDLPEGNGGPTLTGHANGVITINLAEADDVERERRKQQFHEPYRTLLGHFRHEVGHYYWDRLIKDTPLVEGFRAQFGDEQRDYAAALQDYYQQGPPPDWRQRFVTAYATAHPWEDWAETWAHYLHMTETLETAAYCGLALKPARSNEPALDPSAAIPKGDGQTFDRLIESWFSLTYVLNNLNRGLGLADAYPFVLSTSAVEKLRFVHGTIEASVGKKSRGGLGILRRRSTRSAR